MGRILVIRGGAIGDFVLTLPAIHLLRENFPDAEIEILGYKSIVALAEKRFYAVASRSIEYAPLARFFIPGSELSEDLCEYFSGFDQVISYLFDPDGFFHGNLERAGVKNLICGNPKVVDAQHAAYQLAAPLQNLALFLEEPAARLFPADEDRLVAAGLLGDSDAGVIALHPGSGSVLKNWPQDRWGDLAAWLATEYSQHRFLVVSGEADADSVSHVLAALPTNRTLHATGLPLPQLAAALEKSVLFIGHDSGISHIAAAVETRCVLLFGATDPDVWAPRNRGVDVVRSADESMGGISRKVVREAVAEVLGKG